MAEQAEAGMPESPHFAPIEKDAPKSFFRRNPRVGWAALGLLIIAFIVSLALWRYYSIRESTDDAQIDGHIHPVNAKVGGHVLRVYVDDNQFVDAGTVLVEIDSRDYQVAVERARADLSEATATHNANRNGIPITSAVSASELSSAEAELLEANATFSASQKEISAKRSRVKAAQAKLREVQANYQRAANDLERLKPLVAKEEISQQHFDTAHATAEALRAAVESAQADLSEAEEDVLIAESRLERDRAKIARAQATMEGARTAPQQVSVTRAHAESAAARVEQAKSALEQAELNFQYATIRAPVSGVISKRSVEVGQIVQPGQPLLAIVPLEDIWVTANFKETQLKDMHPGQQASVSVDAFGGRVYKGHVESIAAATGARFSLLPPENATGNYVKVVQRIPVKIVFEKGQDREHRLRPGMSVVPTVITR